MFVNRGSAKFKTYNEGIFFGMIYNLIQYISHYNNIVQYKLYCNIIVMIFIYDINIII